MPVEYHQLTARKIFRIPFTQVYIGINGSSKNLLIPHDAKSIFLIDGAEFEVHGNGRFTIRQPDQPDFTGDISLRGVDYLRVDDNNYCRGRLQRFHSFTYRQPNLSS